MDDPRSVSPIFFDPDDGSRCEQVGTGVLLTLQDEVFLLTAAHVTDFLERGALLMPGRDQLICANGHVSHIAMPAGYLRSVDRMDIAYVRLLPETRAALHPDLEPLLWGQIGVFETLREGDLYTFVGFPVSRSRVRPRNAQSEVFKYTGAAAPDAVYSQLGYDPSLHIAMMFDRRRAIFGQTVVHPRGISGGAIFAWPKSARSGLSPGGPKRLVGIAHTFHESPGCMVGTRINGYLAAIFKNNPHLAPPQRGGEIPLFAGIAWYRPDEWPRLKGAFADSDRMHATWEEWREGAQGGIEHLRRQGTLAVPVELTAQEISDFCSSTGLPNIGGTRIQLVNLRLRDFASESPREEL